MKKTFVVSLACLALAEGASAGYTCNGQPVINGTRRCPDGSIPMYQSTPIAPVQSQAVKPYQSQPVKPYQSQTAGSAAQPASDAGQQRQEAAGDISALLGVWHTGVSGGVWQTPSAVPGYDLLHVSPGVRAGDLTIDASGRFVWNSYGGKTGKWVQGDADYPIVLIDTAENRRWKVGPDRRHPGRIFIWDGSFTYNGSR